MGESTSETGDGTTSDSQPTSNAIFLNTLFEVLANRRRRYVLHCLREYQTPIALADLADEVATQEQETPLPDIPAEEVKRVYMSLYHTHIPKLVDANIVEYTQEQDLVALSTKSEHVEPFLERATENE